MKIGKNDLQFKNIPKITFNIFILSFLMTNLYVYAYTPPQQFKKIVDTSY